MNEKCYGLTIVNSYNIGIIGYDNKQNTDVTSLVQEYAGSNVCIVHLLISSYSKGCPTNSLGNSLISLIDTIVLYGDASRSSSIYHSRHGISDRLNIFYPFGGGIGLVSGDYNCSAYQYELVNVTTYQNVARMGANIAVMSLPVSINMTNTKLLSGEGGTGSGITFVVFRSLPFDINTHFLMQDSLVSQNVADSAVGVYILVLSIHVMKWTVVIRASNFTHNRGFVGAALYVSAPYPEHELSQTLYIFDVTISNTERKYPSITDPRYSAVSLVNIKCYINGLVITDSYNLRGLILLYSHVAVYGSKNRIENNAAIEDYGGGIFMDHNSYYVLASNSYMSFINNYTDFIGGAIYIENGRQTSFTVPCFLQIRNFQKSESMPVATLLQLLVFSLEVN